MRIVLLAVVLIVLSVAPTLAQATAPRAAGAGAGDPVANGRPTYRPSVSNDQDYRRQPKPKKKKVIKLPEALIRPQFTREEVACIFWGDCFDISWWLR